MITRRASGAEYPGRFISVIRQPDQPDHPGHPDRPDRGARRTSVGGLTARLPPDTWRIEILRCRAVSIWRRGAAQLREGGPRALLANAMAVLGIRRVTVYRTAEKEALARGAPVPGVTLGMLSDRDVSAYLKLRPDTPESDVKQRLQAGAECVAAWRDGRLVATRWLTPGRAEIAYLGVAVRLHPGVWYAFDAFTLPEARQQGINGMVSARVVERARQHGATAVINAIRPENRAGRGLARRRSQPLGTLGSLRLGRWRILASRLPPDYLGAPLPISSSHTSS